MTQRRFGSTGWTLDRIPDISDKFYVITGANSGLGFEASTELCKRGARVLMLCRNKVKAEAAQNAIQADCKDAKLEFIQLDLSSQAQIKAVSETIKTDFPLIDGLICNAGIMMPPKRELTEDGFELQFGVNHLGHFSLSGLLCERVTEANGRFVIVSSIAHKMAPRRIVFEDLQAEKRYSSIEAYAQSKLANLLFCLELQRRLTLAKSGAYAIACHPGYSNTNLQTTGPGAILGGLMWIGNQIFAQSAKYGAWPELLAATDPDVNGGEYFGPCSLGQTRGRIDLNQPEPQARDLVAAAKLWTVSEELTGVRWTI